MEKKHIISILSLVIVVFVLSFLYIGRNDIAILHPQGLIALRERNLIMLSLGIMLIAVIPAIFLLFFVALKYKDSSNSRYSPQKVSSAKFQIGLWGFVGLVVGVLIIINWKNTHMLDPYLSLQSSQKPLKIQVVSLRWKWLFIYPEQNIAMVNFLEFPKDTPLDFELTSDAPMNSFWIPKLSGQIYTMAGMVTKIHMVANNTGEFDGSAAEISGKGFSGMRFVAKSVSSEEFDEWAKKIKKSSLPLTISVYNKLSKPSEDNKVEFYYPVEENLMNKIIDKYMTPDKQ